MSNKARFRISVELLEEKIELPPQYHLMEVFQDEKDLRENSFTVTVVGPDLPERVEGENIPEVQPVIQYRYEFEPV